MKLYLGESKKAEKDAKKWIKEEMRIIKLKEQARKEIEEGYKIFLKTGEIPFEKDLVLS